MVGECGHIVGAGGKGKGFAGTNATAVATLVGGNDAEVFTEFFVTGEVVEVDSCGPAMQQEKDGRIWWARKFAKENGATARKCYFAPWREVRLWGAEFSHEVT